MAVEKLRHYQTTYTHALLLEYSLNILGPRRIDQRSNTDTIKLLVLCRRHL
jgi:hypothetical protein